MKRSSSKSIVRIPFRLAHGILMVGLLGGVLPLSAQDKRVQPSTQGKQPPGTDSESCRKPAIAYLARQARVLWVSKDRRADVARLYHVEGNVASSRWTIQTPYNEKLSVQVLEVSGNVPRSAMSYSSGDIATIPGLKCIGNVAAVTNQCTNSADGKTSASYTAKAYKVCEVVDLATCNSSSQKVGQWKYYAKKDCQGPSTGSTDDNTDVCK